MKTGRIVACGGAKWGANSPRRSRNLRAKAARLAAACGVLLFLSDFGLAATPNPPRHAIAMHGEPAFPPNFTHMPYVNPDAPKGGRLVFGVLGTFDSLNPLIVRGLTLPQIRGYVIEGLMARGDHAG